MKSDLSTYASVMTAKKNPRRNAEYNPTGQVTKITIHHMAGNIGADQCARMHATTSQQASANYYINGHDIVCGVDEEYRAWTSGSKWNDYKAITIEVANSTGKPSWEISDESADSLIRLCVDICKRHGITPKFDGTKNASFTLHCMFQATECPGPYIKKNILKYIDRIKEQLDGNIPTPEPSDSFLVKVIADCLNIRSGPGTKYKKVGEIIDHGVYTIVETSGNWGELKSGAGWICLRYTREVK